MATNSTNDTDKYKRKIIYGAWDKLLDANLELGRLLNRKQPTKEEVSFLLTNIIKAAESALEELKIEP